MLCLNGWDTFGNSDSPLHEYLKTFRGEIKVLLIEPGCSERITRCQALNITEAKFKHDINESWDYIKDLKRRGINVKLKLYSQKPIWKMIGTERILWLQHYDKFKHVEETMVYEFYKNIEETSIYFPTMEVFYKRWENDGNSTPAFDLESLT